MVYDDCIKCIGVDMCYYRRQVGEEWGVEVKGYLRAAQNRDMCVHNDKRNFVEKD